MPATPIQASWWNNTGSDLAAMLTDSLSRTGLGGMLTAFKLVDGTVTVPAFSFQNESNTGIYRFGPFDARFSVGGVDNFKWTTAGPVAILGLTALAGITSTGAASSAGLTATGGTGNAAGVVGHATGTGPGVQGFSTSSAGSVGVVAQGLSGQLGLFALSSATNIDAARVDGYMDMSQATNPTSTTGFANRLTPKNIVKAWARITTNGSGSVSVLDGFNVASVSVSATTVTVTLGTAFSSTNYAVTTSAGANCTSVKALNKLTGSFDLQPLNGTSPVNPSTTGVDMDFIAISAQ